MFYACSNSSNNPKELFSTFKCFCDYSRMKYISHIMEDERMDVEGRSSLWEGGWTSAAEVVVGSPFICPYFLDVGRLSKAKVLVCGLGFLRKFEKTTRSLALDNNLILSQSFSLPFFALWSSQSAKSVETRFFVRLERTVSWDANRSRNRNSNSYLLPFPRILSSLNSQYSTLKVQSELAAILWRVSSTIIIKILLPALILSSIS